MVKMGRNWWMAELTACSEQYHDISHSCVQSDKGQRSNIAPGFKGQGNSGVYLSSVQIRRVIPDSVRQEGREHMGYFWIPLYEMPTFPPPQRRLVPVGDSPLRPPRTSEWGLSELRRIWDPATGFLHHFHSVAVQAPSHLQTKEFLHFSNLILKPGVGRSQFGFGHVVKSFEVILDQKR